MRSVGGMRRPDKAEIMANQEVAALASGCLKKAVWRETIFIDFIVGCAGAVCAVLYDADSTASRYTRAKHQA